MKRRKPQTDPPDDLTARQWELLLAWARAHEPWSLPEIADLVERCLDHHRALGNTMADWLAASRNWIRNERRFRRRTHGIPREEPRRGVAGAAYRVAETLGLFAQADEEPGELH